jgi:hypothetical protein
LSLNSANYDKLPPGFTCGKEECHTQDDLLCFYDFPRCPKVVYLCKVLAECLEAFLKKRTLP